jgi:exonuclease VII small subunit
LFRKIIASRFCGENVVSKLENERMRQDHSVGSWKNAFATLKYLKKNMEEMKNRENEIEVI